MRLRTRSRADRLAIAAALMLSAACAGPLPNLSPSAVGCYAVEADGYSSVHAAITGFGALPEIVALDTANLGRVLVPQAWRLADPRNPNQAGFKLYSYPWRLDGNYIVFDRRSREHELGADSLTVTLRGWGGAMMIFLARDGDGYSGFAGFEPLMRPEDAPPVFVRLRPAACTKELAEARRRGE